MSDAQDNASRTFEPTENRLREARRKGDVPVSRETATMAVVLSLIAIVIFVLPWQTPRLVRVLTGLIENAGQVPVGTGAPGLVKLGQVMNLFLLDLAVALAPIFLMLLVGALFGIMIQGETVVSAERIRPKLQRVSIREGFKRQFSANAIVEFTKNILKVLVVGAMALWITDKVLRKMWAAPAFVPEHLPGYIADSARQLLVAAAVFMVPVAIADILWRRYDWRRRQMMTHKEVRDELKESEGSEEIRAKRAGLRRKLSRQRVAAAVPTADVVVTNPTHFAVALRYQEGVDPAPVCVAKGMDHVARNIRSIAFDNDILVIENKPLARVLHDSIEVGAMVPAEHWEVVAEIISYVLDLRRHVDRPPPRGSTVGTPLDTW